MHEVHQIRAGFDNTFYLAGDAARRTGVLIDPFDGDSALQALERLGWTPTAVINTHGHWDHVGGNDAVRERYGVPIYAHPLEEVPHSLPLEQTVTLAGTDYQVLHTPGHRPGHVFLYGAGNVFVGDTLFIAGSGNPNFGGDVDALYETFVRLAALPDDTRVLPGHDYAAKNLRFSLAREPENAAVIEAARARYAAEPEAALHATTIGDEKRWNVFLRLAEPAVRSRLVSEGHVAAADDERAVFRALRGLRNTF